MTLRFYFIQVTMTIYKKTMTNPSEDKGKNKSLNMVGGNVN
jgi:hypothetical protein